MKLTKLSALPPLTMRLPPIGWMAWIIIWPNFPSVSLLYPLMFVLYGRTSYHALAVVVIAVNVVVEVGMLARMRSTLSADAIVVAGPLRTVKIPLSQISRVNVGVVYWAHGPAYGLRVITKDGVTHRLQTTGAHLRRSTRQRIADEFELRLGRRGIPVSVSDRWIRRSTP